MPATLPNGYREAAMDAATLPPSSENDRLLKQQIVRCLYQRNHLLHRMLRIDVDRGVVVVRGRLPSFFLRQIAIECIRHIPGVAHVEDGILVADARDNAADHGSRSMGPPATSACSLSGVQVDADSALRYRSGGVKRVAVEEDPLC